MVNLSLFQILEKLTLIFLTWSASRISTQFAIVVSQLGKLVRPRGKKT